MSVFAVATVTLSTLLIMNGANNAVYANSLENVYQRCVYELLDNVNNIDDNLTKVIVSNNRDIQFKYLNLISDECKYAQNNFSLLPITMNTVDSGVKFINQMDGYCSSVVKANVKLSAEQKDKVGELYNIVLELKNILNKTTKLLNEGKTIMSSNILDKQGLTEFSTSLSNINSEDINYPSMIFDGPFSESLNNKESKFLTGEEITQEQAKEKVYSYFGDYSVSSVTFKNLTKGNFETYDFEVVAGKHTSYVQVTKKGGFLLTLSCYTDYNETISKDETECEEIAISFAAAAGVLNMKSVWIESSKGICYINLAPVINNVIYYPDLIKVKVDMGSGKVVGYEAQNYTYNHEDRGALSASVGATDARELVNADVTILSQKLALIPLEYGGEVLCYEFACEYSDSAYYIYINAKTGLEEKVLKVISTAEGDLLR